MARLVRIAALRKRRPLAAVLITGIGWRGAYLAQAGFMAVAVVPLAMLFRGAQATRPTAAPGDVRRKRRAVSSPISRSVSS